MKIAIDMTWLKPGVTGGGESFIRNLLQGFTELSDNNTYILFTAKDNTDSLKNFAKDKRFKFIECPTNANNIKQHLIWQSTKEWSTIKKYDPDLLYNPVYLAPLTKFNKIPMVTCIMDIQAVHYPEYFSKMENYFFNLYWQKAINNSDLIVTISDFCVNDIKSNFKNVNNIKRIYNPIVLNDNKELDFKELSDKYNINKNEYFYTISSLHKHKNLKTLVDMMIKKGDTWNKKLVISGVSGPDKENFVNYVNKNIQDKVILTQFISDEERNCLIKNCNCFLFPSTFEGFGMPPVEAMMFGSKVITTKCASIQEVTQNKCFYVDDPFSVDEWIHQIEATKDIVPTKIVFKEYEVKKVAREYLNTFYELVETRK